MASNWKLAGIHGIRAYVWHLLETEMGWSRSDYRGAVPIVPAQQKAEFNDLGRPYVVYNYSHVPSGEDYYVGQEQASFTIYAPDEQDIREVINMLEEYFQGYDDSATLANHWIDLNGTEEQKKYDYKWIRVASSVGAIPATQDDGVNQGNISIVYSYTREPRVNFPVGPYVAP